MQPRRPPGYPPCPGGPPVDLGGLAFPPSIATRPGETKPASPDELPPNLTIRDWPDDLFDLDLADCPDGWATPLECSRGAKGVNKLMFGASCNDLLASGKFGETLSADAVIHGRTLSWVRGEMIGRGAMGSVYQGLDQRNGRTIAVKEVSINADDTADMKFKEQLETEISICKEVQHPRVVSYFGHDFLDGCLYVYLEYMPGGSLAQVLKQYGPLDESLIAVYTRALLEGLDHLHTRDPHVVHRDIKGGNVLVGLDAKVKFSDFGCSKRTMETMAHTLRGSIPWMAPEVISNTGYGRRADIWSFGCVVIEMATAKNPWGSFDNPMAAMMKIGMSKELPPIPDELSDECRDFIRNCVKRDKKQRPFASQLLQHDFVCDLLLED